MAKLVFDVKAVRELYDHAKSSSSHRPTYDMLFNRKYLKDGLKDFKNGQYAGPDEYDEHKIPPHLQLVKDHGSYLMSGGLPGLPGVGTPNRVVYAAGYGPDADWDYVQSMLGGDDFVQDIPIEWLDKAFAEDAVKLWINITSRKLSIGWEPSAAAKATIQARKRPTFDPKQLARVHKACVASVRPKWAGAGRTYKGNIVEVSADVLYQCVGNGKQRGVVVHECALIPKEFHVAGAHLAIKYPDDVNAMAIVSRK